MNCIRWNCIGLDKPRVVQALKELFNSKRSDMVFLFEMLVKYSKIEIVWKELNFDNCFAVDMYGKGSGLAVF
jgi:hypothetical protein